MLLKTNIEFPELTKELCNTHTGEKRRFTMRPFAPGDEKGMHASGMSMGTAILSGIFMMRTN